MKSPDFSNTIKQSRKRRTGFDPKGATTLFAKVLDFCLALSTRFAIPVVLVAVLLAALGGYVYLFELKIISDRNQLVNQKLRANQAYQQFRQEFGDDTYLALVVSAKASGDDGLPTLPTPHQRERMKQVIDGWTAQARSRPDLFPNVLDRIDWPVSQSLAPLYMPLDDLQKLEQTFEAGLPVLKKWTASPSLTGLLSIVNEKLTHVSTGVDTHALALSLSLGESFFRWLRTALKSHVAPEIELADFKESAVSVLRTRGFDPDGYFFSNDGRIATAFVTVNGDPESRNQYAQPMGFARKALNETLQADALSHDLAAGFAGMPALEYEEMVASESDFARTTLLALLFVTGLFIYGFRSVFRPACAAICLGVAIGMTFGFVWLVIGHLNLLAMVFAVILVALGVDFAIHFLTHYEHSFYESRQPRQAIRLTHDKIGKALALSGLTTSAAFLSAYFTDFTGLTELGLVAGSGLLISLFVMMIVYPAMLFLLETHGARLTRRPDTTPSSRNFIPAFFTSRTITRWPSKILLLTVVLVLLGYGFGQHEFDTNLLNLQPLDGNISRWQRILFEVDDRTTFAISTFSDRHSLERARKAFRDRPDLIRRTESIFPENEFEKRKIFATLNSRWASLEIGQAPASSIFGVKRHLWSLRQTLRQYQSSSPAAKRALASLSNEVDAFYRELGTAPAAHTIQKLQQIDDALQELAHSIRTEIAAVLDVPPFSVEALPDALKQRFLGNEGTLALLVYPSKNTWNREHLEEFVERARTIDPNIFGEIIALYENGRSLIRSFLQSAAYALLTILILLLLWSRSLKVTSLVLIPLVSSVGLLLAIMKWGPQPHVWNFANFFALPILIGMCVDSGIHLVSAWKKKDPDTFRSAVKAVVFSSATTMIGFGILATSRHTGIASLGYILFVGIGMSLLAAMTTLPAALSLADRGKGV